VTLGFKLTALTVSLDHCAMQLILTVDQILLRQPRCSTRRLNHCIRQRWTWSAEL